MIPDVFHVDYHSTASWARTGLSACSRSKAGRKILEECREIILAAVPSVVQRNEDV